MPKLERIFISIFLCALLSFFAVASEAADSWRSQLRLQAPVGAPEKRLHPYNLAIDFERHRYYVVDAKVGRIVSFDESGKELARFDAAGQLKQPVAMVRDRQGALWISDRKANQIFRINLQTKKVDRFVVKHRNILLVVPDRLALDSQDNLYLIDISSGRILKYDTDFTLLAEFAVAKGGHAFVDLKIKKEKLWALDGGARTVSSFALDGRRLQTVTLPQRLKLPVALEIDDSETLYILDRHGREVVVCDKHGRLRYSFFARGLLPGRLSYGSALLFDWRGNLCVADERNGRVEIMGR